MIKGAINSSEWPKDIDVLILGAGFSHALTQGATPLMKGFFREFDPTKYPALQKALKCFGGGSDTNVEELLQILETLESSPNTIREDCGLELTLECIKKAKCELERYCIDLLGNQKGYYQNWAYALLVSLDESTTVITMNYDNFAERILSNREGIVCGGRNSNCPHCKMRMILNSSCGCEVETRPVIPPELWRGALLKLHGSIAWCRCKNPDCCNRECIIPDKYCKKFNDEKCRMCGEDLHPVIVPPSMQKNLSEIPEIAIMWRCAKAALEEASHVGVVGFSFPTSDILFSQYLRNGAKGKNYEKFTIMDINPSQVANRIRDIIPSECLDSVVELPVVTEGKQKWFPEDGISCQYPPRVVSSPKS